MFRLFIYVCKKLSDIVKNFELCQNQCVIYLYFNLLRNLRVSLEETFQLLCNFKMHCIYKKPQEVDSSSRQLNFNVGRLHANYMRKYVSK